MVEVRDISPSQGEDADSLVQDVTKLVDNGRWKICNEGKGLERQFRFKTFKATWVGQARTFQSRMNVVVFQNS